MEQKGIFINYQMVEAINKISSYNLNIPEERLQAEEELKKLPELPGVYIMHDKDDKIIYVGKAISLKNRVRQYFRKNNKTKRIQNMVSLIDHFEYIVTDNEAEALILECNLIKKNMPKFNVLLKDDKTYPYIKVNIRGRLSRCICY